MEKLLKTVGNIIMGDYMSKHMTATTANLDVGEMDEDKPWGVVYTFHDKAENFYVDVIAVTAPSVGSAIKTADEKLDKMSDENRWSDYMVVSAVLVREVH